MYKIVFTDLDGTLLPSGSSSITSNVSKSIISLKNKGIIFVLNTGRPLNSIPANLQYLCDYIVSSNGSMITDCHTGKLIKNVVLNKNIVASIYKYTEINHYFPLFYIDGVPHYEFKNKNIRFKDKDLNDYYDSVRNVYGKGVDNILEYLNKENKRVQKIMISIDPKKQAEIKKKLTKMYPKTNISFSHSSNIEISDAKASKGLGIKTITKNLGISKREIVVCGDNNNDITMFKYAGLVIVPSNGTNEAKNQADIISKSVNNNGVMKIINTITENISK